MAVPSDVSGYESLLLQDTLESVLLPGKATLMVDGQPDTSGLSPVWAGQTVSLTIREGFEQYAGKLLVMSIAATIREGADLSAYINMDIPNQASFQLNHGDPVSSNTVQVRAPMTIQICGKKQLDGGSLQKDQFSFKLMDEMGQLLETVTNNEQGMVCFSELLIKIPEKKVFYVKEVDEGNEDIAYDRSVYTAVVSFEEDLDGIFTPRINYLKNGEAYVGEFLFANQVVEASTPTPTPSPSPSPTPGTTPAPEPDYTPVYAQIKAQKQLIGRQLKEGEFAFTLYDGADDAMVTLKNDKEGLVNFGTFKFSKPGIYVYTIKEVKGTAQNIAYDQDSIRVRISVEDRGGRLFAHVRYIKNGNYTEQALFVNHLMMPQTGDQHLRLPLILLAASALILAVYFIQKKRKTRK